MATVKRNPRDLLNSIVRLPPANPTRAEQLAFAQSLVDRDTCTPRPFFAERGDARPRTPKRDPHVVALVRAGLTAIEALPRLAARLDAPNLTAAELASINFQLRQGLEYVEQLAQISRGKPH
ncbi:MAG: hypothetical protein ABI548_23420 [Polyangiaceae bacterium]